MWQKDLERQQKKRLQNMTAIVIIMVLIGFLLHEWHKVHEKTQQVQLSLTQSNLYQSAINLRQYWEIQNKPRQQTIAGITVDYTVLGWPVVYENKGINCLKLWYLLSNRIKDDKYHDVGYRNTLNSEGYESCLYDIGNNNKLAIYYINDKIHIVSQGS